MQNKSKGNTPQQPLLADLNTDRYKDVIDIYSSPTDTILDAYVEHSNALIELLLDETYKQLPQGNEIISAMMEKHTFLYLNLTDEEFDD